jgi:hypothetical protein
MATQSTIASPSQYPSSAFIEEAGAVLFRLSTREICTLRLLKPTGNQYIVPKGRRHCGESRQAAALRKVNKLTGYDCRLLPVNMDTRAPPAAGPRDSSDRVRFCDGICEPFMMRLSEMPEGHVKIVWWFVAEVEEDVAPVKRGGLEEGKYLVEFYGYERVLELLTRQVGWEKDDVTKSLFQMQRDMVEKAIELVEGTCEKKDGHE